MCMNIINLINAAFFEYSWRHCEITGLKWNILILIFYIYRYVCIYIYIYTNLVSSSITFCQTRNNLNFDMQNIWKFMLLILIRILLGNIFVLWVFTQKCILLLTDGCRLFTKMPEEYLSPIQIKHATFIFITGRWQLLTQDTELIRKPVLYTAVGNK